MIDINGNLSLGTDTVFMIQFKFTNSWFDFDSFWNYISVIMSNELTEALIFYQGYIYLINYGNFQMAIIFFELTK